MALRIPTAHDFRVISARKWARARTQRKNFPQARLDSEINYSFLLNVHGDLYLLLYFSKQCLVGNIQRKLKKNHRQLLFLREESP